MYFERLVSSKLAIFAAPLCFARRLIHPDLVSFGLLANLSILARYGMFKEIDCIIDVGANIGQYAYMVHSILPNVPIHSFEPDPECFTKLEQTFSRFSIPGKYSQLALGNQYGMSTFYRYDNKANNSVLIRNDFQEAGGVAVTVSCSTLDLLEQAFAAYKSIMLKIDVQGFELAVLNGGKSLLKRCKYVQLEASFLHSYQNNSHVSDLFAAMRDNGFRCLEVLDTLRLSKAEGHGLREADLLFVNEAR
jgi:FkbM family methyltransferase